MILLDISVGAPGTPATAGERAFGALLFVTILRDARARPGERLFRRGDLTVELRLVELAVQRAEVGAGRRNAGGNQIARLDHGLGPPAAGACGGGYGGFISSFSTCKARPDAVYSAQ